MKLRFTPKAAQELRDILAYIASHSPAGAKRVQLPGDADLRADLEARAELKRLLDLVRRAICERRRLAFYYARLDGPESERVVQPLALAFWGGVWTLPAWCETPATCCATATRCRR